MAIIWHHACISHSCVYYSSVMWIGACSRGPASAASACRPEQLLLSACESELGSTLLTGARSMKPPSFSPYRAFGKSCTSLSIPFPPLKYFLLRWYRDTAGRPTWMMFMSSPEAQANKVARGMRATPGVAFAAFWQNAWLRSPIWHCWLWGPHAHLQLHNTCPLRQFSSSEQ